MICPLRAISMPAPSIGLPSLSVHQPTDNNGNFLGSLFGTHDSDAIHRTRLEWNYIIRPNLINQAEYGFTRHVSITAQNSLGQNLGAAAV